MVAYLTRSDASEGFNQVIDFLNGSYIKMQALVDKKKVVVTEAAIRDVLWLDDAEGVDFLPNEEIFTELARMGYEKPSTKLTFYKAFFSSQWKFLIHTILQSMSAKRTSWNEFSSTMAFAVICLSTGNLLTHTTKYALPALTQKVFANMRRVGKGFFGVETPLFEGMLVGQEIKEEGDEEEHVEDVTTGNAAKGDDTTAHEEVSTVSQEPSIPSPTLPTLPPQPPQDLPSTSQGRIIDEMDKDDVVSLMDDKEDDTKDEEAKVDESAQAKENEPAEVHEVLDVVTTAKLITEVVTAVNEIVTAASVTISNYKPQVPVATITAAPTRVAAAPSRRRKGVVIRNPKEESTTSSIIPAETKSKDKGKGIIIEEPKPLNYAKISSYVEKASDRSLSSKEYDDTKEQIEEEDNKALQSINETPIQKAAKRRKLNEEVEDLKRHLEIVPDEDDDVYTKATPIARKLILLVERKYPLSRFTLDQMLNAVRLRVKEEIEMSLELLRFTRQQHHEDTKTRIEPESHKENPKVVDVDDVNENVIKEKSADEKKFDDDVEKENKDE
nr:hypothetical protein [Tanacetum cinerariifolium]